MRALVRSQQQRRDEAARKAEEIAYRADRQNRVAQRGDARGVYGVAGADLMRDIMPKSPTTPADPLDDDVAAAALATTAAELTRLLEDRPPGWPWAAFASVLVQRRAAVRSRIRDVELGYTTTTASYACRGADVAHVVNSSMDELGKLLGQTEAFVQAPAFMAVFRRGDDSTADAEGIKHVANRLMDYHERFLALAERCRDVDAPPRYSGLMRDCCRLMSIPLDGYDTFIDDFTEFIARMPELMRCGGETVHADPIWLHASIDDELVKRIRRQVRVTARS